MKYVMLAVVATIGAVALFTIAGAFLWAISEELEDIRDLLRIAYADANLAATKVSDPSGTFGGCTITENVIECE